MEEVLKDFDTEISSWAYVYWEPAPNGGGIYTAYDTTNDDKVGRLSYFRLDEESLMFKEVFVEEGYRRRKVAKALLRTMHLDHPTDRINPGTRNYAGSAFMNHILETEKDLVASNGVLQVPLKTMIPGQFRLAPTMVM